MRIITLTCPNCGTIVADSELERNRVMKCPGRGCTHELRFAALSDKDQRYAERHLADFRKEE